MEPQDKVFKDIVHGHMNFHPLLVSIIDTPQFQRLRDIKQLGVVYFVYPSASHNRFEHSLGTCHLATLFLEALSKSQYCRHTEQEKLAVQIAALCHDLGHGPFSHAWEKFMRTYEDFKDWTHEKASVEIFNAILQEEVLNPVARKRAKIIYDLFQHYGLNEDHIKLIQQIMLGHYENISPEKRYLFEIVSNKANGIDVDKWDYLMRDCKSLGIPSGFDTLRLINFAKVLPYNGVHHIAYRDKEYRVILEMFQTRAKLHEVAYQHNAVAIIEKMLIDALRKAHEEGLKLKPMDITDLICLTDSILFGIYNTRPKTNFPRTKCILERIFKRNLYPCLAVLKIPTILQVLIPDFDLKWGLKKIIKDTVDHVPNEMGLLCGDDFDIIEININLKGQFSNGKEEPEAFYVFKKEQPDISLPDQKLNAALKVMDVKKKFLVVYTGYGILGKECSLHIKEACHLFLKERIELAQTKQ